VHCNPPPTPTHGFLQGDKIERFRGGDIVQFTCDQGYMLDGNPIVICQENSRWSGPPPSCMIKIDQINHIKKNFEINHVKKNFEIDHINKIF